MVQYRFTLDSAFRCKRSIVESKSTIYNALCWLLLSSYHLMADLGIRRLEILGKINLDQTVEIINWTAKGLMNFRSHSLRLSIFKLLLTA